MNTAIQEVIKVLEGRKSQQLLFPNNTWDVELEQKIEELKSLGNSTEMITLIAAFHLRNDSLNLSHSYAQKIEHDPTGAYWHGIMHRMEKDFWNAKYWFRQAGQHPVKQEVIQRVAQWLQQQRNRNGLSTNGTAVEQHSASDEVLPILQDFQHGGWNSEQFCDLVEKSSELDEDASNVLIAIQAIEIEVLFEYTLTGCVNILLQAE